jgi:hypothetical protein
VSKMHEQQKVENLERQAEAITLEQAERATGGAIYMKVDGINGSVTAAPEKEMEGTSFQWGVGRG